MNIWQAILMGVIQGLTEFLPVSSSGHLVLGKIFFGINIETSALFEALLHVGTLGAVFVYFWKDIKMLARGNSQQMNNELSCYSHSQFQPAQMLRRNTQYKDCDAYIMLRNQVADFLQRQQNKN